MPKGDVISTMFDRVAKKYDFMNDFMSLGMHRFWKKSLVQKIMKTNPSSVLDCATGTGDIAGLIRKDHSSIKIYGVDFSHEMLTVAKKRFSNIDFNQMDLMQINYPEQYVDVSCISFGIRNVENIQQVIKEMARVSKKKVFILEFGQPSFLPWKKLYFFMMKWLIPLWGRIFSSKEDYNYLITSSEQFPSGEDFLRIMKEAHPFKKLSHTTFMGGVVWLYEGEL
jgi:demethylmenaquinone methyltransferase / 2-methoxy-6-polyprenyl-1,4-benzoquinol methylase